MAAHWRGIEIGLLSYVYKMMVLGSELIDHISKGVVNGITEEL